MKESTDAIFLVLTGFAMGGLTTFLVIALSVKSRCKSNG